MDNNNIQSDNAATGNALPEALYIQTPELDKSLNQILQLSQAGISNIMTSGPKGSGKSRLLQRYLQHADPTWHIVVLQGESRLTPKQCLQLIAESANLPTDCGEVALIHLIADFTANLVNTGKTPIICIDDMDLLPANTVQLLVQLASESGNNTSPWRLVIFSDSDSQHNAELIPSHSPSGFLLVSQRMPALNHDQATAFIGQLDQHTSGQRDMKNLPSLLGEENTPDDCIRLFMQLPLLEAVPETRPREADLPPVVTEPARRRTGRRGYIIGFAGACIVATVLLFQDNINQLFNPVSTGPDYIPTDPSAIRKQRALLEKQKTEKHAAARRPEPQAAAKPAPTAEKPANPVKSATTKPPEPAPMPAKPAVTQPVITTRPAPPLKPAPAPATAVKPASKPIASKPPATPQAAPAKPAPAAQKKPVRTAARKPTATPAAGSGTRHWLLKQPASNFTLQLMGSYNPQTIDKFMRRHKAVSGLRSYHYTRNNRSWHVVILGSYPSRTKARQAITRLPATLRKQKPWLKKIASIQQELRRNRR